MVVTGSLQLAVSSQMAFGSLFNPFKPGFCWEVPADYCGIYSSEQNVELGEPIVESMPGALASGILCINRTQWQVWSVEHPGTGGWKGPRKGKKNALPRPCFASHVYIIMQHRWKHGQFGKVVEWWCYVKPCRSMCSFDFYVQRSISIFQHMLCDECISRW